MGKFVIAGFAVVVAYMLFSSVPDVARYVKMRRM
jgi:hypothetical protein